MTICNMSIEGGARVGYVNPDETTFAFLRGRPFAPAGDAFDRAVAWWRQMASDADARYDDRVALRRGERSSRRSPGASTPASRSASANRSRGDPADEALAFMGFTAGRARARARESTSPSSARAPTAGCRISRKPRASCAATTSRRTSRRSSCRGRRRSAGPRRREGCTRCSCEAGFEWRGAGCSMCLGMNPDQLEGRQVCASSSNRNFKGRQGSPTGRTLLMSPAMVAAAAIAGEVVDVRDDARGECRHERQPQASSLNAQAIRASAAAGCRCAATTSTPIASCRRGSWWPCRSKGSSGTCSRTIARPIRRTVQRSALSRARRSWSSTRTSAADRRASTRRRGSPAPASARSSASRSRRSSRATPAMLGLPCFVAATTRSSSCRRWSSARRRSTIAADVASGAITAGSLRFDASLPRALRDAFLSGQWNPTAMLLDDSRRCGPSPRGCRTFAASRSSSAQRRGHRGQTLAVLPQRPRCRSASGVTQSRSVSFPAPPPETRPRRASGAPCGRPASPDACATRRRPARRPAVRSRSR